MNRLMQTSLFLLSSLYACTAIQCKACIGSTTNRTTDGGCYDGEAALVDSHTVTCPTIHAWLQVPTFNLEYCYKWQIGNMMYRGCGATGSPPGCDLGEGCIDTNIPTALGLLMGKACCCTSDNCNSGRNLSSKSFIFIFGLAVLALLLGR